METKKLYRSQTDQVIAGVCGGLSEYFSLDPVLTRVVFVLLAFFGGGGVLIYLVLWIAVPKKPLAFGYTAQRDNPEPEMKPEGEEATTPASDYMGEALPSKAKGSLIGGIILLTLGCLFLIDEFLPCWNFGRLWPVILIVIGVVLLAGSLNRSKN